MEARRFANTFEKGCLGRRHPDLALPFEAGEKRAASARIKMRRDFVKEEDGRLAPSLRDKFGMAEDESQKKRLLLTCRALLCRHELRAVNDPQVLAMRPLDSAPGSCIPCPI